MTRRDWMPLDSARSALLLLWCGGGGITFLILTAQSIFGRYGAGLQAVWSWYIPTVVPTVSLMLGVLGASALAPETTDQKVVKVFFFQISRALSAFYLATLLMTIALEPLTRIPATELYTMSNYWLGPLQGLVVAAIGVLFVTKEANVRTAPSGTPEN